MKLKYFILVSAVLVLFLGVSSVSAHGADLTEDTMIIANESNGILAKSIVDNNSFDIKVYKFVSEGEQENPGHCISGHCKRLFEGTS